MLFAFSCCLLTLAALPANALLQPDPEHAAIQKKIIHYLSNRHYNKLEINDKLSSRFLDSYLATMDPSKSYFLAKDIAQFEVYRYDFDDAFQLADLGHAYEIYNRLKQRQEERFTYMLNKITEGGAGQFDFARDEYFELNREDAEWLADEEACNQFWHKRLKATVLAMLLDDKTSDYIEETLTKRYKSRLKRISQISNEDVFQAYINAFSKLYDPHTEYFSPKVTNTFNINMSLSLEGIGALLRMEDEITTVVRVIPAGPADKAGVLSPNDKILAVGQGLDGELVNIVGWRLDDVVELIRGPKNTVVQLQIQSGEATDSKIVQITRNTVKLEEQGAKSSVMELTQNNTSYQIGVVKIPIFYADFKGMREGIPDYRSTTRDVKNLLEEFDFKKLSGIIIDLRSNGGGSLQEANSLLGLFVPSGPTVQVRQANNKVNVFSNTNPEAFYDGPLIVLINRLSASASEIFSGAIQDYNRGLIVGNRSYGKGTVQVLAPLEKRQLKITQAKFYRISGESTQHLGVMPDLQLVQLYDSEDIGESALDNALPWDQIRAARYRKFRQVRPFIKTLREQHKKRAAANPGLIFLANSFARLKEQKEKTLVSLNEENRKKEREENDQWRLAAENAKREEYCLPELTDLDDIKAAKIKEDSIPDCEVNPDFGQATWLSRLKSLKKDQEKPTTVTPETPEPAAAVTAIAEIQDAPTPSDAEEAQPEELTTDVNIEDPMLAEGGYILIDLIELQKASMSVSSLK